MRVLFGTDDATRALIRPGPQKRDLRQKMASGLSGDPMPFSIRSGAAENMNS